MRSRRLLAVVLFGACTVNNTPPPQYGQPQYPQTYPQQQPNQPGDPNGEPQNPYGPSDPPPQQPPDLTQMGYEPPLGPVYTDVNVSLEGQPVGDLELFYDELDSYGTWYDDRTWGWVFVPNTANYQPYTNGHWKFTDYGWTWISADPWGWATDHYGRWVWANRWVWAPDTKWGPA